MRKLIFVLLAFVVSGNAISQEVPGYLADVYNTIFRSMANGTVEKPKLQIINDLKLPLVQQEVATYYPNEKTIRVGMSFLQLTRRFGSDSSNARAHVLSHELAHLFLKHGYTHNIGTGYASSKLNQLIISSKIPVESKLDESAADQWAFFYSHISGYKTDLIASALLDSIYIHYKLTDGMLSRYPPLKDRQQYSKDAKEKMAKMCEAFDFANMALVHGDYEMSSAIFKAILKEGFTSREIYSNLGTTYLLKAIQMKDSTELKYILPVQIDMTTRLNLDGGRGIVGMNEVIENLNKAVDAFKKSISIEPDYSIGHMNLSIALWLLNKNDDSDYYLKRVLTGNEYIKQRAELFQAIVFLSSASPEKTSAGKALLFALAEKGNMLALTNKKIYEGGYFQKIRTYPKSIESLLNLKLPDTFSSSKEILGNTFSKDKAKLLSCVESKDSVMAQLKWKHGRNPDIFIVKQYSIPVPSTLGQADYEYADAIFETESGTVYRLNDLIINVSKKGIVIYLLKI